MSSFVLNEEEVISGGTEIRTAVGFILAFIIYMFIFIYGVQVMKSVNEEKSNRIVEIIISSVKPFELMLGKVVGVALVGLTQFISWVILTLILSGGVLALSGIGATDAAVSGGATNSEYINIFN